MKIPALLSLILFISCSTTNFNSINYSKDEMKLFNGEISKYGLINGDTLLDIGSGFGYQDARIFRFYPDMYFLLEDIDIKYAKKNESYIIINKSLKGTKKYFKDNSRYINGTVDSIPLPSSAYNLILCRLSVHEFTDPPKMLKELRRILKAGGVLIIVETIPKEPGEIDPYCKKRRLSKEELIELFTTNGFHLQSADTTTMQLRKSKDRNGNILKFSK